MEMTAAIKQLDLVQQTISARNEREWDDESCEKLLFCPIDGLLHVEFYGTPFDESFEKFLEALCEPGLAAQVRSLVFSGPDEGTNGTRNWDFTRLLESEVTFPNLLTLVVKPTLPDDHNETIIARDYEEEGQIARLLAKAPALKSLTVPSAPDESFFKFEAHPLTYLRVESGYDTQNFILNLSQSHCFPKLRKLDFGDYNPRYAEETAKGCTSFEHFEQLFRSEAFSSIEVFFLRNSILPPEKLGELIHKSNARCQFMALKTPHGSYVYPPKKNDKAPQ